VLGVVPDQEKAAAWDEKRRMESARAARQAPLIGLAAALLLPVATVAFGLALWSQDTALSSLAIFAGLACAVPSILFLRGRESWTSAGGGTAFMWVIGAFCLTAFNTVGGGFVGFLAFLAALEVAGAFLVIAFRSD
jgi:hypothetical protein